MASNGQCASFDGLNIALSMHLLCMAIHIHMRQSQCRPGVSSFTRNDVQENTLNLANEISRFARKLHLRRINALRHG